jgi:biopolymer transport protein ExbB
MANRSCEFLLPKLPGQVWNMFPGAGLAFVARSRRGTGCAVGRWTVIMTGVPMAGPEHAVPPSFLGRFCSRLSAPALLFGLAIMFGSIAAGHGQPASEPSITAGAVAPAPATAAQAAPAQPPAETMLGELHDLTPLGMFWSADNIVKAVMLGLVFASVLTWTIWLAKSVELMSARRRLRRAHGMLASASALDDVAGPASDASPHVALLIGAAENELRRSPDLRDVEGIKERIEARFGRIEAGVGRQMMRATGIIATIGATAPFIGLFGTVWGIMNSFIGISKLHTTNLAVVAPGIAEALLATACGLAAAIPAVVIYNGFARSIAHYRGLFADASVEVLALVGRDLTRPVPNAEEKRAEERRVRAVAPGGTAR